MFELWTPLRDIPAGGREFSFSEPAIWTSAWEEFGLDCVMAEPLKAEVMLLPGQDGCLIRGRITGSVTVPCGCCTEDATIVLEHEFDEFEPFPEPGDAGPDATGLMRGFGEDAEVDVAGLLWEQFQLALPDKPLCREDCKGLCPTCGVNLNETTCDCAEDEGDPRLAALRNIKLT